MECFSSSVGVVRSEATSHFSAWPPDTSAFLPSVSLLKLIMGHGAIQNGFGYTLTSQASSRKENQSEVKGIGLRKQNVRVVFLEPFTIEWQLWSQCLTPRQGLQDVACQTESPAAQPSFVNRISLYFHPAPSLHW